MRAAAGIARKPVVTCEPVEPELQHDLGRTWRPAPRALHVFEPFEKAAHVEQHIGKLRPDRLERTVDLLARRDNRIAECPAAALTASSLRAARIPARCHVRGKVRAREIGAQPLAGLKLHGFDQRLAVSTFATRKPAEWAFR